jgi:serine/threonine protein kinase
MSKPRKQRDISDLVSLAPISRMKEEFTVVKELGAGAFGKALLVIDNVARRHMVVKILKQRLDANSAREAVSEIQSLRILRHTNVVSFFDAWVDVDERLHMLMEYCDGGDLQEYLPKMHPIPTPIILSFFAQLLIAMDYLHTKHILHRDIKCSNILICRASLTLKIGDFGLSKCMDGTDDAAQTRLGTPFYMSPELVSSKHYTRKTDIWSLGVAFYQLLTNRVPFNAKNMTDLMRVILTSTPMSPTSGTSYPQELSDLVMKMLTKDKKVRPTARELLLTPCLAETIRQCPWQRQFAGMTMMFVCRSNVIVNLRSQPSVNSERLAGGMQLKYGDPIVVEGEVLAEDGVPWFRIRSPVDGYCISEQNGKQLFQKLGESDRLSPIELVPQLKGPAVAAPAAKGNRRSEEQPPPSPIRRTTPIREAQPPAASPPPQVSPRRNTLSPAAARLSPIRKSPATAAGGGAPPAAQSPRIVSPLRPVNRSPLRKG